MFKRIAQFTDCPAIPAEVRANIHMGCTGSGRSPLLNALCEDGAAPDENATRSLCLEET